jgi:hypothetical protein
MMVHAAPMAQVADSAVTARVGGFVDTYYAYDFNRPRALDRAFTTQPARHNEFNVNLAYVEVVVSGPRVRGRLALQTGTSVQANYAGEPREGLVSGPDLARVIQEAVAGYQLAPNLWIDGGIFLSHLGMESFISRDNATYTRSLVSDYSPYYQSGAKLTWTPTSRVTAQFDVVNGWQNISETNSDKALGARVDYQVSPNLGLSYYNFVGNEAPDTAHKRLRVFQGVGFKTPIVGNLSLQGEFDYGAQKRAIAGAAHWYGTALIAAYHFAPTTTLTARVERFDDPEQVVIITDADPFHASSASVGLDVAPAPHLSWRSELRGFSGRHPLFPAHDGTPRRRDAFFVTSFGLSF